jgi:hypothetical protein
LIFYLLQRGAERRGEERRGEKFWFIRGGIDKIY